MLYVPSESSLISNLIFVLDFEGWFSVLSNRFIISWCYIILFINLRPLIKYCIFSGDTSFFCISLSNPIFFVSVSTVPELFSYKPLQTFVTLSEILLPIKSPVAFAVILIAIFEAVLSASVTYCLAWSKGFWLYLSIKFLLIFLPMFLLTFLAKENP